MTPLIPQILDFWWNLLLVSRPGGYPPLRTSSPAWNGFLRFTSGATPADLLMASQAFLIHLLVDVHTIIDGPGIRDRACQIVRQKSIYPFITASRCAFLQREQQTTPSEPATLPSHSRLWISTPVVGMMLKQVNKNTCSKDRCKQKHVRSKVARVFS